jgi:4'-phosphopantetheinyl transferase
LRVVELDDHLRGATPALGFVSFGDEDGTDPLCAHSWLAPAEAAFAQGLAKPRRRAAWLAGRLAAKTAIARLGFPSWSPEATEILPAAGGEPIVRGTPGAEPMSIRVSISHSRGLAAAIAFEPRRSGAMGIDLEACDQPIDPALLDLAFSVEEGEAIEAGADAGERHLRTLRFWTAKEAALKAVWRGLRLPLSAVRLEWAEPRAPVGAAVRYAGVADVSFDIVGIPVPAHVVTVAIEAAYAR